MATVVKLCMMVQQLRAWYRQYENKQISVTVNLSATEVYIGIDVLERCHFSIPLYCLVGSLYDLLPKTTVVVVVVVVAAAVNLEMPSYLGKTTSRKHNRSCSFTHLDHPDSSLCPCCYERNRLFIY